jgi:hypothetical protein
MPNKVAAVIIDASNTIRDGTELPLGGCCFQKWR